MVVFVDVKRALSRAVAARLLPFRYPSILSWLSRSCVANVEAISGTISYFDPSQSRQKNQKRISKVLEQLVVLPPFFANQFEVLIQHPCLGTRRLTNWLSRFHTTTASHPTTSCATTVRT